MPVGVFRKSHIPEETSGVFFLKMKTFVFDEGDAKRYGVDEAVMLWNLRFWIEKNEANRKHFHEGRYWTYSSAEAFTKLFPFWSAGQIRRVLKSLQTQGAILVGNFNTSAYIRTAWYALSDDYLSHFTKSENASSGNENFHFAKSENGNCENEKSIPDNIADNIPDKENTSLSNENDVQKKGTSENLCLFRNSRFADFEEFCKCFDKPEFENIDIAYYYESVKDWSASGGKKKHDWIATARNFMRGDNRKGCLHVKTDSGLSDDAVKYLKMMDDVE